MEQWTHDGVKTDVPAPLRSTVAAGLPVLVSLGMLTVATSSTVATLVLPELGSAVSTGLSWLLALGSPLPLVLAARWSRPVPLIASYAGFTLGRRHVPRERILGADLRNGAVHLLLDDGSILRTPKLEPRVGEAIHTAFARPGDLFATTRVTRELSAVREVVR
ncbi:MAG: hypothetical protein R3F61_38190 [Myxococcota bacterium]